jgi:dTDP-4-dehydrorhamnose 3,5-epimerase-like enzyme
MSTWTDEIKIVQLPRISDPRGNLSFVESGNHLPFDFNRIYWIYDVPGGEIRGGHAYRELREFIISLSGSFDVVLSNGKEEKRFSLTRSYMGLYIPKMIWRSMENFSTNSLAVILASGPYNEDDYIRDFDEYKTLVNG